MLDKIISYSTGIQVTPPRYIDAEYARAARRSIARDIDNFTPSAGYEDLSAAGLLRAFFMNPLDGVIRKRWRQQRSEAATQTQITH